MIIAGMILPLVYILFTVSAVGLVTRRKLADVLAVSFFVQIIVMFVTAIVCKSLIVGIVLYVLAAAITYIFFVIRNGSGKFLDYIGSVEYRESVILVLLIYAFIYVSNYGTFLVDWDEFSHWGQFAKEMYRLDYLYCASPFWIVHQDYVPAISIFETLWCRLSLRYSDANVYRGIQMLQASLLLPMISSSFAAESKSLFNRIKDYSIKIVLVFGGLLFFDKPYHTIYQDIIYGVLVFFCMYIVITEKKLVYKTVILSISLTVLVLAKMTAMAFLPMIILFYLVWTILFESQSESKERIGQTKFFSVGIQFIIPVLFWGVYKWYVDSLITTDEGQSYNGLSKQIVSLFNNIQDYQKDVFSIYIKALFNEGVFVRIPFVFVIIAIGICIYFIQKAQNDHNEAKKVRLIGLWIILASVAYAIMTGLLYLLLFSEYEARLLASYSRYFSTMMVADYLLLILIVFIYLDIRFKHVYYFAFIVLVENLVLFFNIDQLLPGKLAGDEQLYGSEVEAVNNYLDEDDSLLIVTYGSNGNEKNVLQYYCLPRTIDYISVGKNGDDDMWGQELEVDEFVDMAGEYDYIYIFEVPGSFISDYESAFEDISVISNYRLYRSKVENGQIVLTDLDGE